MRRDQSRSLHGRAEDYVEIGLDSEYGYNPLHNELEKGPKHCVLL